MVLGFPLRVGHHARPRAPLQNLRMAEELACVAWWAPEDDALIRRLESLDLSLGKNTDQRFPNGVPELLMHFDYIRPLHNVSPSAPLRMHSSPVRSNAFLVWPFGQAPDVEVICALSGDVIARPAGNVPVIEVEQHLQEIRTLTRARLVSGGDAAPLRGHEPIGLRGRMVKAIFMSL